MADRHGSTVRPLSARLLDTLYRVTVLAPRRTRIASSVFFLPPSRQADPNLPYSVHMFAGRADVTMAICTAKAANLACEMPLPWIFHDDGSLTDEEERAFVTNLPGSDVVRRCAAEERFREALANGNGIHPEPPENTRSRRLVDVRLWGRGRRRAYVDPGALFFRRPDFFLGALNGGHAGNYVARNGLSAGDGPAVSAPFVSFPFPEPLGCAGLWVVDAEAINVTKGAAPADEDSACVATEFLPPEYDETPEKEPGTSVAKIYRGRSRPDYELEGLNHLLHELDFARRWHRFVSDSPDD